MRSTLLVSLTGSETPPLPIARFEQFLEHFNDNPDALEIGRKVIDAATIAESSPDKSDLIMAALDAVSEFESFLNPLAIGEEALVGDVDQMIDESFDRMLGVAAEASHAEQSPSAFGFEIDDELREVFAEEADSLLTSMGEHLDRLAQDPSNKDALWEVRRNAHTLKGSAGIVGLTAASELAHRIEDLLDQLAETDAAPPPKIIPVLLTATECLRAMASGDATNRVAEVRDHIYRELDSMAVGGPAAVEENKADEDITIFDPAPAEEAPPAPEQAAEPRSVVRVPIEMLDELLTIAREGTAVRSQLEQKLSQLDRQADDIHNLARRLTSLSNRLESDLELSMLASDRNTVAAASGRLDAQASRDLDPLEFDRYTDVHESLRELSETAADAAEISSSVEELNDHLEQLFRTQRRSIDSLQERILRTRRISFASLRPRLERIVRLTAADENKIAELHLENSDAEIDTQLIDSLAEPLQHLLKNAVVHGIETPEARRLIGKPETGRVTVSLTDRETHIEIVVADDGAGIAPDALAARAVRTGLLPHEEAGRLSETDKLHLIFKKGLTTAEKLDLNAGRGIGMSIVREGVEAIGGTISVDTLLYGGTRFTLRLPLKLALSNALVLGVGREKVAVPLKNIERVVEFAAADIFSEAADDLVEITGKRHIVRPFCEVLGWGNGRWEADQVITALLVPAGNETYAVTVEDLIRTEELVIKAVGPPLASISSLIGAAELSTGEAVAIIDLRSLLAGHQDRAVTPLHTSDERPLVMVVDDSPSIRHLTGNILAKAGMDVMKAKDGVDALEQLDRAKSLPGVIFTDIEMPRLGGLELAARLRSSEKFRDVPVIVITSRSAEKHRDLAREAGVEEYLTKPFAEGDLVAAAHRYLRSVPAA